MFQYRLDMERETSDANSSISFQGSRRILSNKHRKDSPFSSKTVRFVLNPPLIIFVVKQRPKTALLSQSCPILEVTLDVIGLAAFDTNINALQDDPFAKAYVVHSFSL